MSELTVPSVDFSALGELPDIYKKARSDALMQQTLANLGQGASADADALLKSGNLQLAQLGINARNRMEDQARQAQLDARQLERDKVSDQHWGASYALEKRSADRKDETPLEAATQRASVLNAYKIDPASPEGRSYILTGKLPQQDILNPFLSIQPAQSQASANPLPNNGQPSTQPKLPDTEALDEKTGRREGYLQSLNPKVRDYIRKVAEYEIDPRTTSVKGGMREQLMSAVAKYDPSYNQNDFGARSKAIKDFSTGTQGNIVRSFDVAIDHLDTLQKAATAMQNGDTRVINQIRNKWREQTGSDLPTNFQSLVPLVSGEIAKAVVGSNNALSDREELRVNLQNSNSPSQISGVIQSYKALMGGQLKGLKKQYEETTGKKDFEKRIRDVTRQELEGPAKSDQSQGNDVNERKSQPQQFNEGMSATNPQTGERIIFQNGKWVPYT